MSTRTTRAPARAISCLALAGVVSAWACGSDPSGPTSDPPAITTTELPDGRIDEVYSAGVDASGGEGEYSWNVIGGELPPGLALSVEDLDDSDVVITGTPETEGEFSFDLELRDGTSRADTASLTITIDPPPVPLAIITPAVPPALAGAVYGVQLRAEGPEERSWSVVDGSLPAGLELTDDGQFDGVPTGPETATFTVQLTGDGQSDTRQFTLTVVEEHTDRYDITPFEVVETPPALQANVAEAIRRWEAAITGNLSAVRIVSEGLEDPDACGGFGQLVNGTSIDDILVIVNIDSIDGPGEVLGQAGPCLIRSSNELPIIGALTLDEDDLAGFTNEETVTDILQHEIGHIIGFGTLWSRFELLSTADTLDPRYVGEEAIAEYHAAGGEDETIPVEDDGGEGTKNSHWRETVFDAELLTGFSESQGVDMFLSRMSIASFADLGYQVDLSAADEGDLLARWLATGGAERRHSLGHLGYDIAGIGSIIVAREKQ